MPHSTCLGPGSGISQAKPLICVLNLVKLLQF